MRSPDGRLLASAAALLARAACRGARPTSASARKPATASRSRRRTSRFWNIDIHTPDGGNLPAGEGTVAAGKAVYEAKCIACHGEKAAGGPVYGAMVGGIGSS